MKSSHNLEIGLVVLMVVFLVGLFTLLSVWADTPAGRAELAEMKERAGCVKIIHLQNDATFREFRHAEFDRCIELGIFTNHQNARASH